MGLFDSDYEATGSVSSQPIGQKRDHSDTYFGDLLLMHPVNGNTTADDIRFEWQSGVTASWRKYLRLATRYGFKITSAASSTDATKLDEVKKLWPQAKAIRGKWGKPTGMAQALHYASLDKDIAYRYNRSTKQEYVLKYNPLGGGSSYVEITKKTVNSSGNLEFTTKYGATITTNIKANKPPVEGFFGYVELPYIPTYQSFSKDNTYFGGDAAYFSTNKLFRSNFTDGRPVRGYPAVSLKDNWNNERPYYTLPSTDPRYKNREKLLDIFGIDFKKFSQQIFATQTIPAVGSGEWNKSYGKDWKRSPELQSKYPTENDYRNFLVRQNNEGRESARYFSDVHVGVFVSPKTLDWANVFAFKQVIQDLIPQIPNGETLPEGNYTLKKISVDIRSGSLKMSHKISWIKYGRVRGKLSTYRPKVGGTNVNLKWTPKHRARWAVNPNVYPDSVEDEDYSGGINSYQTNPFWSYNDFNGVGAIIVAISSQMDDGSEGYEYIELHGPTCKHHIDVYHDPDYGRSEALNIHGSLRGFNESDYSDLILFPITENAVKSTPIFKRERLLRETMMVVIAGIRVTEIEWWQKGIFKVLLMVVGAVIGCLVSACLGSGGFAALLAGSSAAWSALAIYVLKAVVLSMVLSAVLAQIDSPLLAAIFVFFMPMLLSGGLPANILEMSVHLVEATNTYLQKKMTQEAIAMEEKMAELQREINKKKEEMERLEKEAGMRTDVIKNYSLARMLETPPGEYPEAFFERTLNRDLGIIQLRPDLDSVLDAKLPNNAHKF